MYMYMYNVCTCIRGLYDVQYIFYIKKTCILKWQLQINLKIKIRILIDYRDYKEKGGSIQLYPQNTSKQHKIKKKWL